MIPFWLLAIKNMKILINITRVIVGILFIFSGLVKAIDPLGLSYKMQEFFELWQMTQFNESHALAFCGDDRF